MDILLGNGTIPATVVYARYVEEDADTVLVIDLGQTIQLQRCRMYNSHLKGGWLYTEYAEKEYEQKGAAIECGKVGTRKKEDYNGRVDAAKRGWETRRTNGR